jgi:hypothetical protein
MFVCPSGDKIRMAVVECLSPCHELRVPQTLVSLALFNSSRMLNDGCLLVLGEYRPDEGEKDNQSHGALL